MIGSTIGLSFAVSLVAGPWLNRHIGVPGIFAMTGVLAIAAMVVVWRIVPSISDTPAGRQRERLARILARRRRSATRATELRHLCASRGADGALHRRAVLAARRGSAARRALEGLPVGHARLLRADGAGDHEAGTAGPPQTEFRWGRCIVARRASRASVADFEHRATLASSCCFFSRRSIFSKQRCPPSPRAWRLPEARVSQSASTAACSFSVLLPVPRWAGSYLVAGE